MDSTVLVTGGTGFLGAYIIRDLVERGYRVRAIRRSDTLPSFISTDILGQVDWRQGDILDMMSLDEAVEDVDAVIHAAGKVSFYSRDRHDLIKINVDGTANVVNAAIERNVRRMVHVSSVAALGRTAGGERVTEDKKWEESRLNTAYAISKFHGELEVWRGIGEGLSGVIVNPSTILGYGDWRHGSCAIFKNVYDEFPWYTNGVNGFVDVVDAARAITGLLEREVSGRRFILSGENWSFRQLFDTIADGFGKKRPHKEATALLGALAWRMEKVKSMFSGQRPLLTRESAKVAQSRSLFDAGRVLGELESFSFRPLAETIRVACAAYLEQAEGKGSGRG